MHLTSTGICYLNKSPFMYFLHQKSIFICNYDVTMLCDITVMIDLLGFEGGCQVSWGTDAACGGCGGG